MNRATAWAWRGAVLALVASIWWQVGGGDWTKRVYWRVYFATQPSSSKEDPRPGGGSALDAGQDAALRDLEQRARSEAAAASAASR